MATKQECQNFINTIGPIVVKNYSKCKILPSIRIAQLIEESGWGTSKLAKNAKNYCGIKYSSYPTKRAYVYNGVSWAVFDSIEECIIQQGEYYMSKPHYYNKVIGEVNLKTALKELEKSPYCADKGYDTRLLKIIILYKLTEFDNLALQYSETISISNSTFEKVQKATKIDDIWKNPSQKLIDKYGKQLIIKIANNLYKASYDNYLDAVDELAHQLRLNDPDLWAGFVSVKPKHINCLFEKIAANIN